jgi:hypothetical protein
MRGQRPGGFAHVPLHRMKAMARVRDMRRAQVLPGSKQIAAPYRDESAKRNLKGRGGDIDVVVATGGGVQIDPVHPNADGVFVLDASVAAAQRTRNVLLYHRLQRTNPARLPVFGALAPASYATPRVGKPLCAVRFRPAAVGAG